MKERNCILVVDDEPLNRELIRRFCHRDCDVEEAANVDEALEKLRAGTFPIRLIVCDQLMPGRCGTELAAEVKVSWPEIPIILLTGYDDDNEVQKAYDDGLVVEIVPKPWRGVQIRQLIDKFLGTA